MLRRLRDRLRELRHKLWNLISKRHDAKRGGDRRKKLAKEVRETRERKDALLKKLKDAQRPDGPTVEIDGKQVALWIAGYVLAARRRGLWHGYVVSGYRSPQYSESLCYAMCGAPSCPGRCAGRASSHSQLRYPDGAVDVDLAHRDEFAAAMQKLGAPLQNQLPFDPNHFSHTGY